MGVGCPYRARGHEELVHLVPDEEEVDVHAGWTQIARLHRRLAFRRRLWSSLGGLAQAREESWSALTGNDKPVSCDRLSQCWRAHKTSKVGRPSPALWL